MSDTPSRKNGRYLRNPRMSSATSTSIPKRPTLHRQSNIDEVLRQQRPKTSRLPGAFESQNIDIDMGAHYSASDPAASTADELAQHTDEACQILGEFIDLPIIVSLMHQEHQLRPTDWQLLKEILKEHKKARLDPRHLIQVLQIRIENQPKILKFVPWGSKKQPRHINNNIHNCIKRQTKATKDLIKTPASKPKPGWIYVFESPENAPGYVKIGKTDREPQERKGEWEKCGITLVEVEDINRNAFDHYSIVESLIKVELHNKRRKYTCDRPHHGANGPVEHEEWYEIDKKTALNSIRRWRHWIKTEEPFNENGLLTPYWYWRAQKLPKFINDADWDRWTQPSPLDYVDFQFEQFGLGYYAQIKAHLGRKDFHFCLTGGMMMFILYTQFGMAGAVWGLLALLIL